MEKESNLQDSFGRVFDYLRVSVIETCNFRCHYCVPSDSFLNTSKSQPKKIPKKNHLTPKEIERFVRILGQFGKFRIRLTGGEPLLRKELPEIISRLKELDCVSEVGLTTNGSLLLSQLKTLKESGLDRLNISLDSLDPKRFSEVTLKSLFHQVFQATLKSLEMGFPVKINVVALKDLGEDEICKFLRLAMFYDFEVRFLEFMPLCGSNWQSESYLPISKVREIVQTNFSLQEEGNRGNHVAQTFRFAGGKGKVGFIAPVSEPFCKDCSRLRLSADGNIKPCLFSDLDIPVGKLLKTGATDSEIRNAIEKAAFLKPKGSLFDDNPFLGEGESVYEGINTPRIGLIGG